MRPFIKYILAKRKEKTQWQNYVADCLWAQASGMTFMDDKHNTTYPRWNEIQNLGRKEIKPVVTKEMVKERFRQMKATPPETY